MLATSRASSIAMVLLTFHLGNEEGKTEKQLVTFMNFFNKWK